jgi:thiol-disulfide isomerase/thioredoxin
VRSRGSRRAGDRARHRAHAVSGAGWRAPAAGFLLALLALGGGLAVSAAHGEPDRFLPWQGASPALALKDLAGQPRALSDYRGKVVLVAFWATWCDRCKDEMPAMHRLKQRLAGRPFEVLAVNFGESRSRAGEYLKTHRIEGYPILMDPNMEAVRAWKVRILPVGFLVGPDGLVRYTVLGEMDWATDEVVSRITALLP